jgi:hypothetical protein
LFIARGEAGFEDMGLRQGDILEGVPFPLMDDSKLKVFVDISKDWDFKSVDSLTPKRHQERKDDQWVTAQIPVRFGYCAVLANCCDLELHDGKISAPTIPLARLHPIGDIQTDPARLASLKANKDPRNEEDPGYIDFFYLEKHVSLQNKEWKVHFNQITSVPTIDLSRLLSRKILQLDDRNRVKFKIKLGFTYARVNKEEIAEGLENPWEQQAPNRENVPE